MNSIVLNFNIVSTNSIKLDVGVFKGEDFWNFELEMNYDEEDKEYIYDWA